MKNDVWFSTGCDLLDLIVGGGIGKGFPGGRIANIVGDKSSGKTFLANELVVAGFYKYGKKFKWNYDDCEAGHTFNTEEMYGVDLINEDSKTSYTVEDWFYNYKKFLSSFGKNDVGIYVLDSLDGLSSAEIENISEERMKAMDKGKEFKKGSYQMGKAKFLSQEFFRGIANETQDKNVLLVIISQTRDKIDSMFKEQYRTGGKALDFFSHTVLWLYNADKIISKNRTVGVTVKAKTKKSKTPRPYREGYFTLRFDYGIDNIASNVDYLFDLRTETGKLSAPACKNVPWGQAGEKTVTSHNLMAFLKEKELYEDYRKVKDDLKSKTGKDRMLEYIHKLKDEELVQSFKSTFGDTLSRDDLILKIDRDCLEDELRQMVEDKWETEEREVKTTERKKKYR